MVSTAAKAYKRICIDAQIKQRSPASDLQDRQQGRPGNCRLRQGRRPLEAVTEDHYRHLFDINAISTSPVLTIQEALANFGPAAAAASTSAPLRALARRQVRSAGTLCVPGSPKRFEAEAK